MESRRARRGRKGSALIETACVLPVFALFLCAVLDLARAFQGGQAAAAAARAGVHQALSLDAGADLRMVEEAAVSAEAGTGLSARASRLCACSVDAQAEPCPALRCAVAARYVRVETEMELHPVIRYPWGNGLSRVRGSAVVRVE